MAKPEIATAEEIYHLFTPEIQADTSKLATKEEVLQAMKEAEAATIQLSQSPAQRPSMLNAPAPGTPPPGWTGFQYILRPFNRMWQGATKGFLERQFPPGTENDTSLGGWAGHINRFSGGLTTKGFVPPSPAYAAAGGWNALDKFWTPDWWVDDDQAGVKEWKRVMTNRDILGRPELGKYPAWTGDVADFGAFLIPGAPAAAFGSLKLATPIGKAAGRAANFVRDIPPVKAIATTVGGRAGFGVRPVDPSLEGAGKTKAWLDYIINGGGRRERYRTDMMWAQGEEALMVDRSTRLRMLYPDAVESVKERMRASGQYSVVDDLDRKAEDFLSDQIELAPHRGLDPNLPEIELRAIRGEIDAKASERSRIVALGGNDPDLGAQFERVRERAWMHRNNIAQIRWQLRDRYPGLRQDIAWGELQKDDPLTWDRWLDDIAKNEQLLQQELNGLEESIGLNEKLDIFKRVVQPGFFRRNPARFVELHPGKDAVPWIDTEDAFRKLGEMETVGFRNRSVTDPMEEVYNYLWPGSQKGTGMSTDLGAGRVNPTELTTAADDRIRFFGTPAEQVAGRKGNVYQPLGESQKRGTEVSGKIASHLKMIRIIAERYGKRPQSPQEIERLTGKGWRFLKDIEQGPLGGFEAEVGSKLGRFMVPPDMLDELKLMSKAASPFRDPDAFEWFRKGTNYWKPMVTVIRPGFWIRNFAHSKYAMSLHGAVDPLNDLAGLRIASSTGIGGAGAKVAQKIENLMLSEIQRANLKRPNAQQIMTDALQSPADLGITRAQLQGAIPETQMPGLPPRARTPSYLPGEAPPPWAGKGVPRTTVHPLPSHPTSGPVTWEELRDVFLRAGIIQKGRVQEIGTRSFKSAGIAYQAVEDALRSSFAIHLLRQGKPIEEVARRVEIVFFNYGPEAFTRMENWLRHYGVMPFLGWGKNSPKFTGRMAFEHPEGYAWWGNLESKAEHATGLSNVDPGQVLPGQPRDLGGIVSPDYRERGGIPLVRRQGEAMGKPYDEFMGLSLNWQGPGDVAGFLPRFQGYNPSLGPWLGDVANYYVGQFSPLLQIPVSLWANKNPQTGGQFGDEVRLPPYVKYLPIDENGPIRKNEAGEYYGPPWLGAFLRAAGSMANVPANVENWRERDAFLSAVNTVTGLPIFVMDLEQGRDNYDLRMRERAQQPVKREKAFKRSEQRDLRRQAIGASGDSVATAEEIFQHMNP